MHADRLKSTQKEINSHPPCCSCRCCAHLLLQTAKDARNREWKGSFKPSEVCLPIHPTNSVMGAAYTPHARSVGCIGSSTRACCLLLVAAVCCFSPFALLEAAELTPQTNAQRDRHLRRQNKRNPPPLNISKTANTNYYKELPGVQRHNSNSN